MKALTLLSCVALTLANRPPIEPRDGVPVPHEPRQNACGKYAFLENYGHNSY